MDSIFSEFILDLLPVSITASFQEWSKFLKSLYINVNQGYLDVMVPIEGCGLDIGVKNILDREDCFDFILFGISVFFIIFNACQDGGVADHRVDLRIFLAFWAGHINVVAHFGGQFYDSKDIPFLVILIVDNFFVRVGCFLCLSELICLINCNDTILLMGLRGGLRQEEGPFVFLKVTG